jgi:hypothetical protein
MEPQPLASCSSSLAQHTNDIADRELVTASSAAIPEGGLFPGCEGASKISRRELHKPGDFKMWLDVECAVQPHIFIAVERRILTEITMVLQS